MDGKARQHRVVERPGEIPCYQVSRDGLPLPFITAYLTDLTARDFSRYSIRTYAYGLLYWVRFLDEQHIAWERATSSTIAAFVLDLKQRANIQRERKAGTAPAGSMNLVTGKRSLPNGYAPSTINSVLAVLTDFYTYHVDLGTEILQHPLLKNNAKRRAPNSRTRRALYRQRVPRGQPRGLSEDQWNQVFELLRKDRDRALFALAYTSGVRASELLNMTLSDIDWAASRVRVISKGTRSPDWVAAGPQFFQWLTRYLVWRGPGDALDPLWLTDNVRRAPLSYTALRGVLRRVNERLGSNWVIHDFRHSAAINLANDPRVPLEAIRAQLRHAHITTTQHYIAMRPEQFTPHVLNHYERRAADAGHQEDSFRPTYDSDDLSILFPKKPLLPD